MRQLIFVFLIESPSADWSVALLPGQSAIFPEISYSGGKGRMLGLFKPI